MHGRVAGTGVAHCGLCPHASGGRNTGALYTDSRRLSPAKIPARSARAGEIAPSRTAPTRRGGGVLAQRRSHRGCSQVSGQAPVPRARLVVCRCLPAKLATPATVGMQSQAREFARESAAKTLVVRGLPPQKNVTTANQCRARGTGAAVLKMRDAGWPSCLVMLGAPQSLAVPSA